MKRWGRKGYFFVIDAIIGSAIIFISLYIILGGDVRQDSIQIDFDASEDYASFLINTRIQDLNNEYINNLTTTGIITNSRNTLMEQVDQFYYNGYYVCPALPPDCRNNNISYATKMLHNITDLLVTDKYGLEYSILDDSLGVNVTIYNRSIERLNSSNIVIVSRKITFLQIDSSTMFGPKIVQIKLWI